MQARNMTPTSMQLQGYTVPQRTRTHSAEAHRQSVAVDVSFWRKEMLCIALILFCACFSYVLCNKSIEVGHQVTVMEHAINTAEQKHRELEYSVSTLKSPVRIQEIAEKDFGMILPDTFIYSEDKMAMSHDQQ